MKVEGVTANTELIDLLLDLSGALHFLFAVL